MSPPRFQLFTTVWGEWHLEMLERITLPTLLAAKNLPALATKFELIYTFYTRAADSARLAEMPVMQALSGLMKTAIVSLTTDQTVDIANHMKWWAALIDKAKSEHAFVLAMQPDAVWADGAFARIVEALARGKKAVQIPNFRILSETSVKDICVWTYGHAISIPPRQLMKLGVRHMHPLTMAEIHCVSPSSPGQDRLWPVPGEGFVLRSLGREVLFFDPRRCSVNNYMFGAGIEDYADIELLGDSDEFVSLNLTPLVKDIGFLQLDCKTDLENPAKWSLHPLWDAATADDLGGRNMRYVFGGPTKEKWEAAETVADQNFAETLRLRRQLKAHQAIQMAGCTTFARMFAMAIQVTCLAKTFDLKGNETFFVPSDEAIATLGSEGLAWLCGIGNEAELADFVARSVDSASSVRYAGNLAKNGREIVVGQHRVCVLDGPLELNL